MKKHYICTLNHYLCNCAILAWPVRTGEQHPKAKPMTTREAILKAAREVFERFGFNKTSMADIAQAARKGRRTIYTHFLNKEEIFRAVIETEVREVIERLEGMLSRDIPPDEKLRLYAHQRMKAVRDLTIYYEALRQDLMNNLGLIENLRKEYDRTEIGLITSILDEGVEKGIFHIRDTGLVAQAFLLATKGFELPLFMGETQFSHSRYVDPLIDVFYRGIMSPGAKQTH